MENQPFSTTGETENKVDDLRRPDETGGPPPQEPEKPPGTGRLGFLELVYGVLFEPVTVMRRVAAAPPLGLAVLIFTLVNLIDALMSAFVTTRLAAYSPYGGPALSFMQTAAPVMAVAGLLLQYVKWFIVSALIHFIAALNGGRGKAVGTMTVTALAALPAVLLVPVNLLLLLFGVRSMTTIMILPGLVILVWSAVLVVLGIREVHKINTGQSLLAVILPPLALLVILFILFLLLAVGAAAMMPFSTLPRY